MASKRERIVELLAKAPGTEVTAKGWVRTKRSLKRIKKTQKRKKEFNFEMWDYDQHLKENLSSNRRETHFYTD